MPDFNPNVDNITADVSTLMKKIFDEYRILKIDPTADPLIGAGWAAFHLGSDYFLSARDLLKIGRVLSGGALVRASFENVADAYYIYGSKGKTEKYAKAYVDSIENFRKAMIEAARKGYAATAASRSLKQANKWTGATIEQRLQSTGSSLLVAYDLLSYFGHPNPGTVAYLGNKGLREGQINLLKQCNCINAINLMALNVNRGHLSSVSLQELDDVAKRLGFKLLPEAHKKS